MLREILENNLDQFKNSLDGTTEEEYLFVRGATTHRIISQIEFMLWTNYIANKRGQGSRNNGPSQNE